MIAERIQSVEESKSVKMAAVISELRSQGQDIISFNVGEPDFPTPTYVIEATKQALDEGHTRYALVPGELFLRDAIVKKLKRDQGLDVTAANICLSNGSKQVLYSIFQLICNPGDEVIIPRPFWVSFPEAVKLAGGKPVFVDSDHGHLSCENIEKAINEKTKAIVINSPSNPSGLLPKEGPLKKLVELAKERGIYIISDEAYETLTYGGRKFVGPAGLADPNLERTLIVQSFSKSYCMTGFRLGYIVANNEIIKAMAKLQSHVCGNVPVFIQKGALAALEHEDEIVGHMREVFGRRIELAYKLCKDIFPDTDRPEGAFYLFPKISQELLDKYGSDENLSMHILKEAKVALLPGSFFGEPGYLRICFATSDENIEKGFRAIKDCL